MREYVERRERTAKIFGTVEIALILLWIASFFLLSFMDITQCFPAIVLTFIAWWTCGIIYLAVHQPFLASVKQLHKKGLEYTVEDIDPEKPTFPKSKLCCGQRALFSKKSRVIIPYGEIAWVYLHETQTYGITTERYFVIYSKDRKKYTLKAKAEEFKWLLENRIAAQAPDVVVGFGKTQRALYRQRTAKSK